MAVAELAEEVPSSRADVPSNVDDVASRILLEVAIYRCCASSAHIAVHTLLLVCRLFRVCCCADNFDGQRASYHFG